MKFNSLIPELSVTDVEKSKLFYLNLGFEIKYQREKFYFLEFEENQIMIEEDNKCYFWKSKQSQCLNQS